VKTPAKGSSRSRAIDAGGDSCLLPFKVLGVGGRVRVFSFSIRGDPMVPANDLARTLGGASDVATGAVVPTIVSFSTASVGLLATAFCLGPYC